MTAEPPRFCWECGGDIYSGHNTDCSQCECKTCGDTGELLNLRTGRWVACLACDPAIEIGEDD